MEDRLSVQPHLTPTTIDSSGGGRRSGAERRQHSRRMIPLLTNADVAPAASPAAETLTSATTGLSGEAAE